MNDTPLLILRDRDIFPDAPDISSTVWKDRSTGKAVIFNEDGDVALIGNKVNDFFLLPGGGIDEGETVIEGLRRECQEETGLTVEVLDELGMTEDFRARDGKHCLNFGYSAKAVAQGTPNLTANEADIGAYVRWMSLPEALTLLAQQEEQVRNGEVKFYNTCFNTIRDLLFLTRASGSSRHGSWTATWI